MRKIFAFLLLFFAFALFSLNCEAKQQKKKKIQTKHKIEFVTKDKFILVGDLYLANKESNKPLVVGLHSFALNGLVWSDIAQDLRLKNYNVLAMDLRGHGRSVYNEKLKIKSRYRYTQEDWAKLPDDVLESIAYIKKHYPKINSDEIIFMGADIGASAAILTQGSLKKEPQKFVLISPMINYKGLFVPIKVANYKDTKFLVILSKSDKLLFNFHTKTKPKIIEYSKGGPGNQLLKVNPESKNDIVNFIIN